MNPWQVVKNLRYRIGARKWPDAGGGTVIPSVKIVPAAFDVLFQAAVRKPVLGIKPGPAVPDPETRGFMDQRIDLLLVVDVVGDDLGEPAMVGAGRPGGAIQSQARGILEVEEELKREIRSLVAEGFRLTVLDDGDSDALEDQNGHYLAYRTYTVLARCTEDRYYHPPRNLVATGGVGSVALTWVLPPDRYDRRSVVLRRAAGATPPASATAGVGVALVGFLPTSVVDAGLAPGTYSYAIFGGYDETGSATNQRFSAQETGTTRASVTVT